MKAADDLAKAWADWDRRPSEKYAATAMCDQVNRVADLLGVHSCRLREALIRRRIEATTAVDGSYVKVVEHVLATFDG